MNARQTKKLLKKKINTLESDNELMKRIIADSPTMQELYDLYVKPLNLKVEHHKIDTLKFERYYPEALVQQSDEYVKDILMKDLSNGLVYMLKDYATFDTEFCPNINQYRFRAEVDVVRKY